MRIIGILAAFVKTGGTSSGSAGPGFASPAFGGPASFPRLDLLDHMFIIRALILRYVRLRHQETRLGFMMEFMIPVLIIVFHTWLFIVVGRWMPGGIPQALFVTGGFTSWFTFSFTAKRKILFRGDRGGGLNWSVPHVTPMHSFIALGVWRWMTMVLLCFGAVAVAAVFTRNVPLPDVVAIVPALSVAALLGFGYGLAFGTLGRRWWVVDDFRRMFLLLLFMTSGLYSIDPVKVGILNEWYNPMYHVIQTMRHALYPSYPLWRVTMLYPVAWGLGLAIIGLLLHRWMDERSLSDPSFLSG